MKVLTYGFLAISLLTGCSLSSNQGANLVGHSAPYTRLTSMSGDTIGLRDSLGKRTFILFWATKCAESKRAVQRIAELARQNAGRSDIAFDLVSVDPADKIDAVNEFIKTFDAPNVSFFFSGNEGDDEAFLSFNGSEVPYVVIVGPSGLIEQTGSSVKIVADKLAEFTSPTGAKTAR